LCTDDLQWLGEETLLIVSIVMSSYFSGGRIARQGNFIDLRDQIIVDICEQHRTAAQHDDTHTSVLSNATAINKEKVRAMLIGLRRSRRTFLYVDSL
jgi:hypothetical protein